MLAIFSKYININLMNRISSLKEIARNTKEHLSYEEAQLAIGEFSISAAGVSLAFVGLRYSSFVDFMVGGVMAQAAFESGTTHIRQLRDKNLNEPD
jgi:hypothetical protein